MQNCSKILFFALFLILFSCKKDDDTQNANGLVGTWKLTDYNCNNGNSSTNCSGVTTTAAFTFTAKDYNAKLTFNADASYTSSGTFTEVLTTDFNGQTFTQDIPITEFLNSGTYAVSGNTMTITQGSDVSSATIVEQTATILKLRVEADITTNENGCVLTQTGTFNYTLEKQ